MPLLQVVSKDLNFDCHAWNNFCDKHKSESGPIFTELLTYGGRDVFNSPYIEFETEEQMLIFVLKFS